MWAFFSRRARLWLITVLVAPVASLVLGRLGTALERRNGPNTFSRGLRAGSRLLDRGRSKARARAQS
ncbi:hypothetical protein LJR027_000118 [Terrabacter sp. LjRoot27]|uniref:hypothetical protein n=1 Tax=Terrabacter sp. LjRoot27 TaxID=3342306 RepID=UPI003ED06364